MFVEKAKDSLKEKEMAMAETEILIRDLQKDLQDSRSQSR